MCLVCLFSYPHFCEIRQAFRLDISILSFSLCLLKEHKKIDHAFTKMEDFVTCRKCSKTVLLEAFSQHLQTCSGMTIKPFKCETCPERFTNRFSLNVHMRIHNNERPFQCSLCDHKSRTSVGLKRHALVHSDVKPFTCEICQASFRNSGGLKVHMMNHTGKALVRSRSIFSRPCARAQNVFERRSILRSF